MGRDDVEESVSGLSTCNLSIGNFLMGLYD